MAVLSPAQRQGIRADFGNRLSTRREIFNLTKPQLDAAIAAIDDWIETNAASFNAALPLPARTMLTTAEKAELFSMVALKRYVG